MIAGEIEDFEDLLITAECNCVTDWEMDFIEELTERFGKYKQNMFITEKQLQTLENIARKQ
jgi:hypothetical protein